LGRLSWRPLSLSAKRLLSFIQVHREKIRPAIWRPDPPSNAIASRVHAIPPKSNRYDGITYSRRLYEQRNLIERCFNKLKQFRHIATRCDRNALNYLAMVKIAIVRLWIRFYESTT
jgi:transposase